MVAKFKASAQTVEVAVSRSLFAGLICLGLVAGAAQAQSDYPNRTVKIVVPSTPGGGSDTFARLVAQNLSEADVRQILSASFE